MSSNKTASTDALVNTSEDLEQRRFPGAVKAQDANLGSSLEHQIHVSEKNTAARQHFGHVLREGNTLVANSPPCLHALGAVCDINKDIQWSVTKMAVAAGKGDRSAQAVTCTPNTKSPSTPRPLGAGAVAGAGAPVVFRIDDGVPCAGGAEGDAVLGRFGFPAANPTQGWARRARREFLVDQPHADRREEGYGGHARGRGSETGEERTSCQGAWTLTHTAEETCKEGGADTRTHLAHTAVHSGSHCEA